jgi:hypothetical protein
VIFLFWIFEIFFFFVFLSIEMNKRICIRYKQEDKCPIMIPCNLCLWEWNEGTMVQMHGKCVGYCYIICINLTLSLTCLVIVLVVFWVIFHGYFANGFQPIVI